jgi:hypothetical protein
MRFRLLKPLFVAILLLNATAAQQTGHEPAANDFRLETDVSRSVVRAGLPVTVFANLTNETENRWDNIRVSIETSDEFGSPLAHAAFPGQTFGPHGSKSCRAVFRFEEPIPVTVRVTLTRGKNAAPFFVREQAARIAVTPVNVIGENGPTRNRDGCQ